MVLAVLDDACSVLREILADPASDIRLTMGRIVRGTAKDYVAELVEANSAVLNKGGSQT